MKQITFKEIIEMIKLVRPIRLIEAKSFGSGAHIILTKKDIAKEFIVVEVPVDESVLKDKKRR